MFSWVWPTQGDSHSAGLTTANRHSFPVSRLISLIAMRAISVFPQPGGPHIRIELRPVKP